MLIMTLMPLQVKAQTAQYDMYSITIGVPPDTIYMKRYTDSLYRSVVGVLNYIGRINPRRYYQYPLINAWPNVLQDTTALSDSIGKKLDKTSFAGAFNAALTSVAIVTALGFTPYNGVANPNGFITQSESRSAISLTTTGTSGAATYNSVSGSINIPNYAAGSTYTAGAGIAINGSNVISNTSPNQVVSLTGGTGISITGAYPNFTITNTYKPVINYSPGRSVNTNYTPSVTRPVQCVYTFTCSTTNPLVLGTSSANVYAEYSTNGGSSWNAVTQNGTSNGVGVTVTVALTVGQTSTMTFMTTENYLYRLRTATSGTASVSLISQNETTF